MSEQERPEPGTPAFAQAEAIAFNHFYRLHPEFAGIVANTFLLRSTGAELGLDLLTAADIKYVADYLGHALAKNRANGPEPTPAAPPPSYDERLAEYQTKMKSADSTTLRKIALVSALRSSGYSKEQISVELKARNFSSLTDNEIELLSPPEPTEGDVRAVEKSAADEVSAASQRIGALLGLGRPATRSDIHNASNDSLRKILWPHGQGTRKELSVERDIDLILQRGVSR